ncbi:CDP-glucose 4,6-dehydratase [Leptospira meyeri]|uniref:CDP-glucose 4,6-dehydratase n=1 Tax=Leptospira meyeri TaxID=29508 RepID=UPI00223CFD65|nr:CDP-glucose 4,6-dehydratase [Leptospira meyeri]MCW7490396.1 CDP-glucose 4,6-dehydratase [Leptospira meyeri]
MGLENKFWKGKSVFITGHTGFKGSWLSLWLSSMGANVHGYSLASPTNPNLFSLAKIESLLASHIIGDVRDYEGLSRNLKDSRAEIVFHLAAQPLVRRSYSNPIETYSTNVMGTVNILESVRHTDTVKALVNVTTDKCYENQEWIWAYRENEPMGGFDPYSSSKGCSELVTSAYKNSFFSKQNIQLASARAGNVIGGGDWSEDRLVPDIVGSILNNQIVKIRNPNSIRPWQHVLEPLSGYLCLAEKLFNDGDQKYSGGWNFGPKEDDAKPVLWIVEELTKQMGKNGKWEVDNGPKLHEANYLKLDCSKAKHHLNWEPKWTLNTAITKIAEWYEGFQKGADMQEICLTQISEYQFTKR